MFSHPWFALIVIFHVLSAVIGFGALGMTGAYAGLVRRSVDPYRSEAILRYFRPGRNAASYALYAVPIFGGIAFGFSGDAHKLYPYLGIAIWLTAAAVASGLVWPAEARIQRMVTAGHDADEESRRSLAREARRCERGASVTSLLFLLALVVMIAQP